MEASRVLLPALLVISVFTTTSTEQTLSVFQTAEIIAENGYPSETHHVTTSDGYILEMHRIPQGKGQSPSANRPVVFLMHGLLAASNSYILLGPDFAPGYNLADSGFDVWMGNARGNVNSRFHVTLDPDDSRQKLEFFDFSYEEIAIHDLPAMIDYVLQYTGQEKLHYIGHSQGGTTFLILNSMLPEYNDKIESAHLLAGVGYQDYFPNTELSSYAALTDIIYNAAVLVGFVELFPPGSTDEVPDEEPADDRLNHCTGDLRTSYMCDLVGVRHLVRSDTQTDDSLGIGSIFDELQSAGAALKQIAHYGQNIRDKSFQRWSYGIIRNLIIYGNRNPPAYDLSLITINTTMHYTVNDNLLDERDVLAMADVMPNTAVRKVARETFLHEDFVMASDAKELVTDYIVEVLRRDAGLPPLYSQNNEEEAEAEDSNVNPENSENEILPVVVDNVIESGVANSAHSIVLNTVFTKCLILLSIFFICDRY